MNSPAVAPGYVDGVLSYCKNFCTGMDKDWKLIQSDSTNESVRWLAKRRFATSIFMIACAAVVLSLLIVVVVKFVSPFVMLMTGIFALIILGITIGHDILTINHNVQKIHEHENHAHHNHGWAGTIRAAIQKLATNTISDPEEKHVEITAHALTEGTIFTSIWKAWFHSVGSVFVEEEEANRRV